MLQLSNGLIRLRIKAGRMFDQFKESIKVKSYTLRFNILSIFVMLLIISMTSLIALMYVRATNNITFFAFDLMKQISTNAFVNIDTEFNDIEVKNKAVAKVIASGVISLDIANNQEMVRYARHILEHEGSLFPILKKFFWADEKGNVVFARKMKDGGIETEIIYHMNNKTYHRYIYKNQLNDTYKIVDAPETNYNPTTRYWYIQAVQSKKTTWIDIYNYYFTQDLGISVVTPVISKDDKILGVIKFDIGVEFIRKLVEDIKFSKNSVVFIVSKAGKLIAYPKVVQYKNKEIMNIHQSKIVHGL